MRQDVSTEIGLIIVIDFDDNEVMICQFRWGNICSLSVSTSLIDKLCCQYMGLWLAIICKIIMRIVIIEQPMPS